MTGRIATFAVAAYPTKAAARSTFEFLRSLDRSGQPALDALAILEKGADGWLRLDGHHISADLACCDALLGGALNVIAAPLGIAVLGETVRSSAGWAGAIAIVGHLWYGLPRAQLHRMSELLEDSQAALVAVAADMSCDDVIDLLSPGAISVVSVPIDVDLEDAYTAAAASRTLD